MANPQIEVIPAAPEQAPIVANLLELYVHDFSEFLHLEIGEDGRFGYASLSLYWSEPDRHPLLVRVDGKLAGLALVTQLQDVASGDRWWDMAEFFILRGYRRCGIGTQAAQEVWRRFPGRWQVRVMQSNTAARQFWANTIASFAGEAIDPVDMEKNGQHWSLFSFESS